MKSSLPIFATRPSVFLQHAAVSVQVKITIVSEANDQLRIALFTCVSKVIDSIEERMPLLSSLQHIYIWSAGCSA